MCLRGFSIAEKNSFYVSKFVIYSVLFILTSLSCDVVGQFMTVQL